MKLSFAVELTTSWLVKLAKLELASVVKLGWFMVRLASCWQMKSTNN